MVCIPRHALVLIGLLILCLSLPASGGIVYVKLDSPTNGPGNDWDHACHTVTAGLAAAVSGDEVWVAKGTYKERITLKIGVGLYGGFAGTETAREQRNWATNTTSLNWKYYDTAVVTSPTGSDTSTCIDGFTIRSLGEFTRGVDCSSASPLIRNNKLIDCGIRCISSSPTISNNTIGAGLTSGISCTSASSPLITNNTIAGNDAASGAGIYCNASSPVITNNIVAFNSSGIHNTGGHPVLRNNDVYANESYDYLGVAAGSGDFSGDPCLVSRQYGNLHIQPNSPCIDAGLNQAAGLTSVDIDGQTRIAGAAVDIGADESDGVEQPAGPYLTIRVSPDGNDSNTGLSWDSPKKTPYAAAKSLSDTGGDIWLKAGSYSGVTLPPYVHLYGGFCGNETHKSQRNWAANKSIVQGRVSMEGGYRTNTVDGLALKYTDYVYGCGISCYNSSPTVANNSLLGCGIVCESGRPLVSNNTIFGSGTSGILCRDASPTITNNTIAENGPSGIQCIGTCSPIVSNNIVAFNAWHGIDGPTAVRRNNDVFGNCLDSTETPGEGDISKDPLFAGPDSDYRIRPDSPCVDAGWTAAPVGLGTDIDCRPRIQGAAIDIGADESDGTLPDAHERIVVRVSPDGDDLNDGSSWQSAKRTIAAGFSTRSAYGTEVWAKAGDYSKDIEIYGPDRLYGGFAGTETSISQRKLKPNKTVVNNVYVGGRGKYGATYGAVVDGITTGSCIDVAYCANARVSNNTLRGGHIQGLLSDLITITNNVIAWGANDAAIGVRGCDGAVITNNTVVGNNGAAISGGSIIANNIIAFNSYGIYGQGVLSNNNVFGNVNGDYDLYAHHDSDISRDPCLGNEHGDLHIQPNSPCIDAGLNNAPWIQSLDMDDQARVQGAGIDIGADEYDGTQQPAGPHATIRVSPNGDDSNSGLSWESAKKTIIGGMSALTASGGDIWLKAGIYNANFHLPIFVHLYGGFAGNETSKLQRNLAKNKSTVTGKIWVTAHGCRTNTVDGLTINASGMGIDCDSASPLLINNTLTGCGIYCNRSSALIANNTISGSSENGIYASDGDSQFPTIVNNTIVGSSYSGIKEFAVWAPPGYPRGSLHATICNNILAFNHEYGVDMYTPDQLGFGGLMRNNNVFGNTAGSYRACSPGKGDISAYPGFVSDFLDLHIGYASPCRDAGWNGAPMLPTFDFDGEGRIFGSAVDIGADEYWLPWLSVPDIKKAPDGAALSARQGIVSAAFTNALYVEGDNRAGGIRVEKPVHGMTQDTRVDITGTVTTNDQGERCIVASDVHQSDPPGDIGSVAPVALANAGLGGGPFGLQAGVSGWVVQKDAQGNLRRVWGKESGLNNIGLLVKTWGKFTRTGDTTFTLDDGSGLNIKCIAPEGVALDDSWTYATVTGVCSCERAGEELRPVLLVRSPEDIVAL